MFDDLQNFVGFRNLDSATSTIAKALESKTLYDYGYDLREGLIALAVTGSGYSDEAIIAIAERLPEGQSLWAFSPTHRRVNHNRLKLTHVPAESDRVFVRKVADHLSKFVMDLPVGTPLTPPRLTFPDATHFFASSDRYVPVVDLRSVVTREIGGVPYEFFSDLRSGSRKLVVFGQSAVSRGKTPLPYFFRWTWAHRINASVMIWNDPTLYVRDDINAGWWIGHGERDYIVEAIDIIKENIRVLGLRNEDVVFIGLSAGGMSAMPMATLLPGSHAILENPRVTMAAKGAKFASVNKILESGLGYPSAAEVPQDLRYRMDIMERIRHSGHLPSFTYLQNMRDHHHAEPHYARFRHEVQQHPDFDPSIHKFVEYEQWSLVRGGHFPLKESAMLRILDKVLANDFDFPEKLSKEEITRD